MSNQVLDIPEYPKIETLFDRNDKFKVMLDKIRLPEFEAIKHWHVTEKIDGTNFRIALRPDGQMFIGGRTDKAQLNPKLVKKADSIFTPECLKKALWIENESVRPLIVLFCEAYGCNIQHGGNYNKDYNFRIYDVLVEHIWLKWDSVKEITEKICIKTVPDLGVFELDDAISYIVNKPKSIVAREESGKEYLMEGIVAKSEPLMLTRMGKRIIWKLKVNDFSNDVSKGE